MSQFWANQSRRARSEFTTKRKKEAFRLAMLSVRGRYDPPKWVLRELTAGDRAEYEAAKATAGIR